MDRSDTGRIETQNETPEERVFNIDLLFKKILESVIYPQGHWKKSDIKSCRLVNRNWLRSTNHCLLKSEAIFFGLYLSKEDEGAKLNKFLSAFNNNQRLELGLPPLEIVLHTTFLIEDNRNDFLELLSLCGASVLEMTLYFGEENERCSEPLTLPDSCSFDNLKKLSIEKGGKVIGESPFLDSFLGFIQSILNCSPKLRTFYARAANYYVEPDTYISSPMPQKFQSLVLPLTIQDLRINTECFSLLMQNSLPIVRELSITLPIAFPSGETLSQVLYKFRRTLEVLLIFDTEITRLRHIRIYRVDMPLMERLTVIENYMSKIKLEIEETCLHQKVPKLTKLKLDTLDLQAFRTWITGWRFETVKDLDTSINNTFTEERWQSLTLAFPNLESLSLCINLISYSRQMNGLRWVFCNMKKLKCLKISLQSAPICSDIWDLFHATIIGTTKDTVIQLRVNPITFWMQVDSDEMLGIPSIRDLTELEELHLDITDPPYRARLQDSAFHLAFLKMDKLKQLQMRRSFCVSKQIKKVWIADGRTIDCFTIDTTAYEENCDSANNAPFGGIKNNRRCVCL